jgi:hypothetical protein
MRTEIRISNYHSLFSLLHLLKRACRHLSGNVWPFLNERISRICSGIAEGDDLDIDVHISAEEKSHKEAELTAVEDGLEEVGLAADTYDD